MGHITTLIDYGVIGLLVLLSVWAFAVVVERWMFFRRINLSRLASLNNLESTLTKRLVVIGTVAAHAPSIGLLGTVFGVMLTKSGQYHCTAKSHYAGFGRQ